MAGRIEYLAYTQAADEVDTEWSAVCSAAPEIAGVVEAASAFTDAGASGVPLSKLGSFVMMNTWFFRIWCSDIALRRRALLERADSYLGARTRIDPADAAERLEQFGRQLGFDQLAPGELQEQARKAGKRTLAAQLGTLTTASATSRTCEF